MGGVVSRLISLQIRISQLYISWHGLIWFDLRYSNQENNNSSDEKKNPCLREQEFQTAFCPRFSCKVSLYTFKLVLYNLSVFSNNQTTTFLLFSFSRPKASWHTGLEINSLD